MWLVVCLVIVYSDVQQMTDDVALLVEPFVALLFLCCHSLVTRGVGVAWADNEVLRAGSCAGGGHHCT